MDILKPDVAVLADGVFPPIDTLSFISLAFL